MTARASTAIGLALLEVALVVRPEDEFALRHLPAAGNVLLSQLKRQLAKVDRNAEIVGYCRGPYCVLSFEAGGAAQEAGLQRKETEGRVARMQARWIAGCGVGAQTSAAARHGMLPERH